MYINQLYDFKNQLINIFNYVFHCSKQTHLNIKKHLLKWLIINRSIILNLFSYFYKWNPIFTIFYKNFSFDYFDKFKWDKYLY